MKKIVATLVFILLPFCAHAQDKPDRKLAIEYLQLARYEQIIDSSIDTYSRQLLKSLSDSERGQLEKIMREVMGWEATKDQLADLVSRIYTKAELKASIAFMKTPLGASATAKSDAFSEQYSAMLTQQLLKFLSEHPVQPNPAANSDAPR